MCQENRTFGVCDCDTGDGDAGGAGGSESCKYPDVTPCEVGGNVLLLHGEPGEYIHPGRDLFADALFFPRPSDKHDQVSVAIETDEEQIVRWHVVLSTSRSYEPLLLGEYTDTVRSSKPAGPELSVSGYGRGCGSIGKFRITDLEWYGPNLTRITAAFEQQCEDYPGVLCGCIHYTYDPAVMAIWNDEAAASNDGRGRR